MHEILPGLYLSNFIDAQLAAKNMKFFQINATKDFPMFHDDNIRVPIDDDRSDEAFAGFLAALPVVMAIIDVQLERGVKVVVHCLAGQQRSAALVAAYLLHTRRVATVADAVMYIRERKRDAFFWSVNFREPLETWASHVRNPM